jgi:hypothetical protein
MTRRIMHLIEEQENRSKLFRTRDLGAKVEGIQESREPTPDREEVLTLNPSKYHQQRVVIMPREDKNQNGKGNTETQITGKKARKLNKKKVKLEKL